MQNAQAVGIETPPTWFPQNGTEAAKLAKDVGETVLIKPRSQLAQRTKTKGSVVESRGQQVQSFFDSYMKDQAINSEFAKQCPVNHGAAHSALLPSGERQCILAFWFP